MKFQNPSIHSSKIMLCIKTCASLKCPKLQRAITNEVFSEFIQELIRSSIRPRWLSWMRCPTGDQEVAGSTPAEVGNILSWRLIMKYIFTVILSLPLIQEGQLSVSGERMCTILVNRLED